MSISFPVVYVATGIKDFAKEIKSRIPELTVRETDYSETGILSRRDLKSLNEDAEIVFADGTVIAEIIYTSKKLKWAEFPMTGLKYVTKAIKHEKYPDFALTISGTNSYGRSIAEYLVGQILAWERHFFDIHEEQKSKIWTQSKWVPCRMLDTMTIGIFDSGSISIEVESFCKALGMKVLTIPGLEQENVFDLIRKTNIFSNILENCDFVCNLLPCTTDTRGLVSDEIFKQCKKKPVFISIGGVDKNDKSTIVTAIRNNWISGAIIDICPGEQSTKDSELSSLPNVIITHHASAASNYKTNIDDFENNVYRYTNRQQLNSVFNLKDTS